MVMHDFHNLETMTFHRVAGIGELTILGREREPRLYKIKTAITEIKAVKL